MMARKIENGYQFESTTADGAFIVRLILGDDGSETLASYPVGVPVTFKPRQLESGTIQQAIGPERWENFLSMKEKGIATMFIDPYRGRTSPRTW